AAAIHVRVVVAGILPTASVNAKAFFSKTAGLARVRWPVRVAPLPCATSSSWSGTKPAYARSTPMPVAAGATMVWPMKSTPISARASEKHGRERDESQGHQEVRDDAVAVKPSILRPHGRHAADRQQHDAGAKPRKATAHGGFEFLDV